MSTHPEQVIRRILVVDDTPSIHRDFRKILCPEQGAPEHTADLAEELFGAPADPQTVRFEVNSALQGQVALEMVRQSLAENRPYALAFVDVRMPPGWDGIQTISHLWEICPCLQVVICTAYSDYSWEAIRARLGQPDGLVVLKKPFATIEVQQLAHALTRKWDLDLQAKTKLDELEQKVAERTRELERQTSLVAESEEKLRSVLDNAADAVFIASPEGRYVYVNRAASALLEYSRQELLSMAMPDITPPAEISSVQSLLQRVQAEKQVRIELQLKRKDGALVPVELNGTLLPDGNVYSSCRDVTERKQAEEAIKASLREKEVMLKEIHHRVKNNLQVIASLVDIQANALADPGLQGLLQDMQDRVRSMALVHEKLYQSESLAQVGFADYVHSLLSHISRSYGRQGLAIELKLDLQPVSLSVETAVPCGLILSELISNAYKHAFRGRATGRVSTALGMGPDGQVFLQVSDDGVGLPAGMNWRQSPSLGLQLIDLLAGQLDATVEVCTEGGTAFTITLPPEGSRSIEILADAKTS